jgi:hypothetical protein
MSKKVDFLATKYGITSLTNDNLQLFVSEIYNDGFSARQSDIDTLKHDIKYWKEKAAYLKERIEPFKLGVREHFAALAMQGLIASPKMGDPDIHDSAKDWIKDITETAYEFADAMLKVREVSDER